MLKYTITELSRELGISVPATSKKVNKLQLRTNKEFVNNRMVKMVILSDSELNDLKKNTQSPKFINQNDSGLNNEITHVNKQVNYTEGNDSYHYYPKDLIDELLDTKNKLINYAEEAGKNKLLTDNLINRENDVKHWQNEYFNLQNKLNEVKLIVNKLETENQQLKKEKDLKLKVEEENKKLKEELQKERNKPFWKKNIL